MKIRLLLISFLFLSFNLFAQTIPEVSIKDVQFVPADSLIKYGAQNSEPKPSYDGKTVYITGVVMCPTYEGVNPDSVETLHSGAPAVYLQDPNSRDWSGILLRDPTESTSFAILDTGIVIKVKVKIGEYHTTTQANVVEFDASNILNVAKRPAPVKLTLDSLFDKASGAPNYLAEKWEQVYVELDNLTSADKDAIGGGSFKAIDDNGMSIIVGAQADFLRREGAPVPGTKFKSIKGFIETRTNVDGGWFIINPVSPDDIVKSESVPPSISEIKRDIVEVKFGEAVTVSANIVDNDSPSFSAEVVYTINDGAAQTVAMAKGTGDEWTAQIPAQNDSSIVAFFIKASDSESNSTYAPADTVKGKYFYYVLNRDLKIKDVQLSPYGSGYSAYNGYEVTVSGVVTADTSDIEGFGSAGPQVYIQNGKGMWNGIQLFGTEAVKLEKGDLVTVTGIVNETYGVTRLGNNSAGVTVTVNKKGEALPEAAVVTTGEIGTSKSGQLPGEAYECVLVAVEGITVTDDNSDGDSGIDEGSGGNRNHGEISVVDASALPMRIELQEGTHDFNNFWSSDLEGEGTRISNGDKFSKVTGIMTYSFGNYKLIPRTNDDFEGYVAVGVEEIEMPESYELSQNYPNPFNPTTNIKYSVVKAGNVNLTVYNILGQKVMTLVNDVEAAGTHQVKFDASKLTSGIYLYKIQVNDFVSVKKMMLVK